MGMDGKSKNSDYKRKTFNNQFIISILYVHTYIYLPTKQKENWGTKVPKDFIQLSFGLLLLLEKYQYICMYVHRCIRLAMK